MAGMMMTVVKFGLRNSPNHRRVQVKGIDRTPEAVKALIDGLNLPGQAPYPQEEKDGTYSIVCGSFVCGKVWWEKTVGETP